MYSVALECVEDKEIGRIDVNLFAPDLSSAAACFAYGKAHGLEGWRPEVPDTLDLDLIDQIWLGYSAGLVEGRKNDLDGQAAARERHEAEARGQLPDPEDLAAEVLDLALLIPGQGAAARFLRAAAADLARQIPTLGARSWPEFVDHDRILARENSFCRGCGQ